MTSSVSETRYTKFDNLGRLTESEQRTPFTETEQVTDATPRISKYKYNFADALIGEIYPNGRVVTNTLDAGSDLAQVSSKKDADYGFLNYAGAFTYAVAGAVSSMRLGNGKWESTTFNAGLQLAQIRLGSVQGNDSLLKLAYSCGTTDGQQRQRAIPAEHQWH